MTPEQKRPYTVEVRIDGGEWREWCQRATQQAAEREKVKAARLARVTAARVVRSEDR